MTGSTVSAAIVALADAISQQIDGMTPVEVGMPLDLDTRDRVVFVSGSVRDWVLAWATTPQQGPDGLVGLRNETYTLQVFLLRTDLGTTVVDLMCEIDPWRRAVEQAVLADRTLGGTLGASGMATVAGMQQDESSAGDRGRAVGLTISVDCDAYFEES